MINNKIKVMLVDDQPLVLEILSKGISKDKDIEIVCTDTDGLIALNMVNRFKPDVIILDMGMPRMNGIQFLLQLMPVNPIPTIVLSALTSNDSKITDEAFNAGGAKTRIEIGDYFGIGQKNTLAVKASLLKAGITLLAEDTGGTISRTATLTANSTHFKLYYHERGEWEL